MGGLFRSPPLPLALSGRQAPRRPCRSGKSVAPPRRRGSRSACGSAPHPAMRLRAFHNILNFLDAENVITRKALRQPREKRMETGDKPFRAPQAPGFLRFPPVESRKTAGDAFLRPHPRERPRALLTKRRLSHILYASTNGLNPERHHPYNPHECDSPHSVISVFACQTKTNTWPWA